MQDSTCILTELSYAVCFRKRTGACITIFDICLILFFMGKRCLLIPTYTGNIMFNSE